MSRPRIPDHPECCQYGCCKQAQAHRRYTRNFLARKNLPKRLERAKDKVKELEELQKLQETPK